MSEVAKETIEILGAAVEEMLNSLFEYIVAPYTTDEMKILIEEDTTVLDIVRLLYTQVQSGEAENWTQASKDRWNQIVRMMATARKISAKVGKPMIEKYFTYDRAMQVFKERRPDMYEIFKTEDGKRWLEKNIQEIVEFLTKE